jgi:hypothetical protein
MGNEETCNQNPILGTPILENGKNVFCRKTGNSANNVKIAITKLLSHFA